MEAAFLLAAQLAKNVLDADGCRRHLAPRKQSACCSEPLDTTVRDRAKFRAVGSSGISPGSSITRSGGGGGGSRRQTSKPRASKQHQPLSLFVTSGAHSKLKSTSSEQWPAWWPAGSEAPPRRPRPPRALRTACAQRCRRTINICAHSWVRWY
eukprot:SAG11_NODE_1134_length_5734_cov_4.917480_4_plen_153_part_00